MIFNVFLLLLGDFGSVSRLVPASLNFSLASLLSKSRVCRINLVRRCQGNRLLVGSFASIGQKSDDVVRVGLVVLCDLGREYVE